MCSKQAQLLEYLASIEAKQLWSLLILEAMTQMLHIELEGLK